MNSREKGKRGERLAAEALNDVLGTDCRRSVQYKGTASSADLDGLPGFHLEVKFRNRLNVPEALARCQEEASSCNVPLLMHRRDREPWILTIYASDLPRFVERMSELMAAEVGLPTNWEQYVRDGK